MNQVNRFEESWSPKWDLGLQSEFGFDAEQSKAVEARPQAAANAATEVSGESEFGGRMGVGPSSIAEVISFFETLGNLGA